MTRCRKTVRINNPTNKTMTPTDAATSESLSPNKIRYYYDEIIINNQNKKILAIEKPKLNSMVISK